MNTCGWRFIIKLPFRLFFVIVCSLLFFANQYSYAATMIKAAVINNFPPQYRLNSEGQPTGFAIDVMDEVAKRAGIEVEYETYESWHEIYDALRTGKVDIIPNMGITKRRERKFDFTEPVESFEVSLFVRSSNFDIHDLGDLKDRPVAVVETNVGEIIAQDAGLEKVKTFTRVEQALFSLMSGQVDALIFPKPVIQTLVRETRLEDHIKTTGPAVLEVKRAIAVRKGESALLEKLNATVKDFTKTKRYRVIYEKWYAEPRYWTTRRVIWVVVIVAAITFILAVLFRIRTLSALVASLNENILKREKAEEDLTGQQKFTEDALNALPDNFFVMDSAGKLLRWNRQVNKTLGLSDEELLYKSIESIIPNEEMPQVRQALGDVIQEGLISFETRVKGAGGIVNPYEIYASALGDPFQDRILICGIARDVSERKAAEEIIRKSEEEYRRIVETSYEGIWVVDANGNTIFTNKRMAVMLGYEPEELIGTPLYFYLADECGEEIQAILSKGKKSISEQIDIKLRRKDGTERWTLMSMNPYLDSEGNIVGALSMVTDITERKNAENELRRINTLMERTFASLAEAVLVIDIETNKIITCNDAVRNIFGYTRDELTGCSRDTLHINKESYEQFFDMTAPFLEKEGVFSGDFKLKRKNGEIFFSEHNISLIHSEKGEPLLAVSVVRDITERKRSEEKLKYRLEIEKLVANLSADFISLHPERLDSEITSAIGRISRFIGVDRGNIFKFSDDYSTMENTHEWAAEGIAPLIDRQKALRTDDFPWCMESIKRFEHVYVTDMKMAPVTSENEKQSYAVWDIKSFMAVPLITNGRLFGFMSMISTNKTKEWDPEDVTILKLAGEIIVRAIKDKRMEQRLRKQVDRMRSLRVIDQAITGTMEMELILKVVIDEVREQLNVDAAAILLLNPVTKELQYGSGQGFRTDLIKKTKLRLGGGVAGRVAYERKPVYIEEKDDVYTAFFHSDLVEREDVISYFAVPLTAKGEVKGVLEIFQRHLCKPDDEWREFLEALAGQAAIAIDNATLFRDLQRINDDLVLAYDTTIEGWSNALDYRDKETEGHSERVTNLTIELARRLGLSEQELVHVRRGALLHDIGKLGVPDNVLLKPGPLTEEEWVLMKRHPEIAYKLLSPIPYLRQAVDIPYCHHEKMDGTGYPRGLKGEEIPLVARMFAVVDIFDALSSDRPYRVAWEKERIINHLEEISGSHLDEKVVGEFLSMVAEELQV